MKKKFILLPIAGLLLMLSLQSKMSGPAYNGLGDLTGSSGTSFGCSCHSSMTSSTAATVSLLDATTGLPVTTYVPGTTYRLKMHAVNNSSSTLPNFGFQMTIVKSSGAGTSSAVSTGTFGTPGSANIHVQAVGSVNIVEHYNVSHSDGSIAASSGGGAGGGASTYDTSITWTAPVAGTGSVVLYGIANLVDHSGTPGSPDQWNFASTVTICEQLPAITGVATVCAGATTTLSNAVSGGTWSSVSPSIGSINTSGVVTGISGGTTVISYSAGCAAGAVSRTVTVNAVSPGNFISAGGPSATVCVGASTLVLSNINPGGSWSSASTGVATVSGGTVTGVSAGTAVISYTLPSTGCAATTTVTVLPVPADYAAVNVCVGRTITVSTTPAGGTWTSGNTSIATVGASTGLVTGVGGGLTTLTYTLSSGCFLVKPQSVSPNPSPITGTFTVCTGATTTLGETTPGGTWSSVSTGIATIAPSGPSGIATGVSAGTSVISYTIPATGCASTATVTVNSSPTITGTLSVCPGTTSTLSGSPGGGTWLSGSTGVATIGSGTGVVTGSTTGISIITYTAPATGCTNTATVTVNPNPSSITGSTSLCIGSTNLLSDATSGGSWSSNDPSIGSIDGSGNVTGVSVGTTTITYTTGSGCFAITTVTVNSGPAVAAISPSTINVCFGGTTTATDATPAGAWSSSNAGIASVGTAGLVTGVAVGAATVSYTVPGGSGCSTTVTAPAIVNPLPPAPTGTPNVCVGASTPLSDASGSGTWTSSGTGTVSLTSPASTTSVTGLAAGPLTITYTFPGTGCSSTLGFTVNALPASITGTPNVCVGATTTLSTASTGGAWSSTDVSRATVGTGTGIVSGILSGGTSPVIRYTLPTGCFTSQTVTVNPPPGVPLGAGAICMGSTATLVGSPTGGTWTSGNTGVATIGSTSGTITTVSVGTAAMTYTLATGCFNIKSITVNPTPTGFSGALSMCIGTTSTYSYSTGGGIWNSSNTGVATVGSTTGLVTAIGAGTANITYSLPTGCFAQVTVTVNALPALITGTTNVCVGASRTLSDGTPGGTWTSGDITIATVGTGSGSVTGVSAGTVNITYTLSTGCFRITPFTVNPSPAAITGAASVCVGQTTPLASTTSGGTWTSSNTAQATIGTSSGVVTGVLSGTPTISYTLSGGCFTTRVETVNPLSAITGSSSSCAGATTNLSNATAGGTWTSSNTAVATIGSSSGIVTALTTGTTTISYTLPSGCVATLTFNVISAPSPISGPNHICIGASAPLTDPGGGTWTSSAPSVASIGSSTGIMNGLSAGTTTITYSLGTGCSVNMPVTVNPLPSAITGPGTVCVGATAALTELTTGGTWSTISPNASVGSSSGIVTGITAGTALISYTSALGCSVTKNMTVDPAPAAISGTLNVCVGATTTLSDGTAGGTWSSGATGIATIGAGTGIASGVAVGTAPITYTLTSTTCTSTAILTVNPVPASITGTLSACVGSISTLADATAGGTWTSSPTTIATVGSSSGDVTGVTAGTATITYALSTGCKKTASFTVNPLPTVFTISGGGAYCAGGTGVHIGLPGSQTGVSYQLSIGGSPLGSPVTGTGASIDFGLFTTAGTYTVVATNTITGCTSSMTGSVTITINPLPSPITGTPTMCEGSTTTLVDATAGGSWTSSPTTIATVGSTGIVTGVAAGSATITYTAAVTGCFATYPVTVNPLPAAIGGTTHVCVAATTTLTDGSTGGAWTSSDVSTVTIGSSSGTATGVLAGSATITYTLPTGCLITTPITVNALPVSGTITGPTSVCAGATVTLTNATVGGTWSSSNTTIATVGTSGIVSGVTAGLDTIRYTVTNICSSSIATYPITVNPLPLPGTITGGPVVCIGTPATFTETVTGGTWSSSNTAIVTAGSSSGLITGVANGTATITYTVTNGCGTITASVPVTVNTPPVAGTITGIDSVCEGDSILLSDTAPGGIWSASNANASVSSTGGVTGVTAGTTTISYTVTNDCGTIAATLLVTIRSHAVCNVGVKPLTIADGFNIYPNPSSGSFTVEIPETVNGSTITVDDVLGKNVATRVIPGTNAQKAVFNLGNVASGSYFVSVHAGDKIYRAKVVIW